MAPKSPNAVNASRAKSRMEGGSSKLAIPAIDTLSTRCRSTSDESLGISAEVGVSFASEPVTFEARPSPTTMEWQVSLPGVGFVSAAVPPNPLKASYAGYEWNPAVIFRVPLSEYFAISGTLQVDFEYDWTRGICARRFNTPLSMSYPAVPDGARKATPERVELTILETLRSLSASGPDEDGVSDTFLAAIQSDWLETTFGTNSYQVVVHVPRNKAIMDYLIAHPDIARDSSGPFSPRWLSDWLVKHVELTHRDVDTIIKDNPGDERIQCTDGVIVLTDTFEPVE
jgi:hypothetical protein